MRNERLKKSELFRDTNVAVMNMETNFSVLRKAGNFIRSQAIINSQETLRSVELVT
jgi:hypothetical protein